ncbi:hypothetical protein M8494_11965 [Serratia ureilytica]
MIDQQKGDRCRPGTAVLCRTGARCYRSGRVADRLTELNNVLNKRRAPTPPTRCNGISFMGA